MRYFTLTLFFLASFAKAQTNGEPATPDGKLYKVEDFIKLEVLKAVKKIDSKVKYEHGGCRTNVL